MTRADGYVLTESDLLRKALRQSRLYRKNLLYRGFSAANIQRLIENGQDRKYTLIACAREEQIELDDGNVFAYARDYRKPAVAVFDSKFFELAVADYDYIFKHRHQKRDALIAVYKLRY